MSGALIVVHPSSEMSSEAFLLEKLAHPGGFLRDLFLVVLTLKTVSLVFLASGRRGSAVHAFSGMDQDIALNWMAQFRLGSFQNF